MARKRGGFKGGGKTAYRMTARRKAALRNAQLISARKRRRGNVIKAGVLAGGVAVGVYAGQRYHAQIKDVASSVKNYKFRFNNPANAAKMTPAGLEANMKGNAVSPAAVASQAPPPSAPNMNNTSTPAPKNGNGPAAKAVPGFGGLTAKNPTSVQNIPSEGRAVDPFGTAQMEKARDPNQRTPHPMAAGMTRDRISEGLKKAGTNPSEATWREIAVLAEVQAEYLNRTKNAGFKVSGPGRGNRAYTQYYRTLLDIMEIPSAGDLRRAKK